MKTSTRQQNRKKETMSHRRQAARFAPLLALLLVTIVSVQLGAVADDNAKVKEPSIQLGNLAGPWQITLVGYTGCGETTLLVDVTLNSSGSGTATYHGHSGCGDDQKMVPFAIDSLNPNGSGTAGLSCGSGCGWNFAIQVDRFGTIFNLVDVTDPNNYLQGVAVRQ
jgi:hypothetical protein